MTREVVVFATRQSRGSLNAEANRFLFRLEQEFDLMRLRDRRMVLEYEEGGKTLLTVRQTRPTDPGAARGQLEGWNGSLEKLAATLAAG